MYVVYTNQTILWRVRSIRTYLSAHVRAFFYVLFKCFHFSPLLISSFSFLKDLPPIRSSSTSFILSSFNLSNCLSFGVLFASSSKKSLIFSFIYHPHLKVQLLLFLLFQVVSVLFSHFHYQFFL